MLIQMEHKESFHAFKLKTIQCNETKTMLKNLSTIDDFLSPDEFEFAVESCPLLGIIHKPCGHFLDIFESLSICIAIIINIIIRNSMMKNKSVFFYQDSILAF